jgi:hypothetical protein
MGLRMIIAGLGATLYFATVFPAVPFAGVFAGTPAGVLTASVSALVVW